MAASKIIVQHRDGSPARRVRVRLGFDGLARGMSGDAYTNDRGEAIIDHSGSGRATVYVSGRDVGKMQTPGTTVVTVS